VLAILRSNSQANFTGFLPYDSIIFTKVPCKYAVSEPRTKATERRSVAVAICSRVSYSNPTRNKPIVKEQLALCLTLKGLNKGRA